MTSHWRLLFRSTSLRLLGLGIAFVTSIVVARALGAEARGLYQIVLTTGLLCASLGGLSGELGFAERMKSSGAPSRERVLATLAYGALPWGLCVALVAALVSASISGLLTVSHLLPAWQTYAFVACFALLGVVGTWTQRTLNLLGRPVAAAAAAVLEMAVPLLGVLVALWAGFFSLSSALFFGAVGTACGVLCALAATRLPVTNFRAGELWKGLASGLKYHPSQVALQLLSRFDVLLLGAMASLASVGHYTVAVSITAPLAVLAGSVSTTFLNKQFVESDAAADRATLRILLVSVGVVSVCSLVIGLGSWVLIPLLWGAEFEASRLLLLVLLPGVVALAAQRPLGNYFVRYGRAGEMTTRVASALVVNLALCIWLIPEHGAMGAAVASTIAYVVYAGLSLWFFKRGTGFGMHHVLEALRPGRAAHGQPVEEQ